MSDPTLSALVFIGLVFGGVAAASTLTRVAVIVSSVVRELTRGRLEAPLPRPRQPSCAA